MNVRVVIYSNKDYLPGAMRLEAQLSTYGVPVDILHTRTVNMESSGMPWLGSMCYEWFGQMVALDGRTIVLDADLLMVGDISPLFTMQGSGLFMVPDHYDRWQTGVVVMDDGAYDWLGMYRDLVDMIPLRNWLKGDQTLLNEYLEQHPEIVVTPLERGYSWCTPDGLVTPDTRMVHYHGRTKPWMKEYDHRHPFADEWGKKQIYE